MNEYLNALGEVINNNSNIDNYFKWLDEANVKNFNLIQDNILGKINSLGSNINGRFDIITNTINDKLSALSTEIVVITADIQFLKIAVIILLIMNIVALFGGWKVLQRLKKLEGGKNDESNIGRNSGNSSIGSEPSTDGNGLCDADSGRKTVYSSGGNRITPIEREKPQIGKKL